MKKNHRTVKALLASLMFVISMVLTACGGTAEESTSSTEADTSVSTEATTETVGEGIQAYEGTAIDKVGDESSENEDTVTTTTESETDASGDETSGNKTSGDQTEGKLPLTDTNVVDIAERGFEAMATKDFGGIVKYTNIDAMYYLGNGEWISDEELVAELKKANANESASENDSTSMEMDFTTMYTEIENIKFSEGAPISQAELDEMNEFIIVLTEGELTDYVLTNAYKLPVTYDNMSEEEQAMLGTDETPCMYVVEYNGEWKLDVCVSLMMEIYNAFSGMTEDMTSGFTEVGTVE